MEIHGDENGGRILSEAEMRTSMKIILSGGKLCGKVLSAPLTFLNESKNCNFLPCD
jgi:hypothetical protein